jgi:cell division protein FtsB
MARNRKSQTAAARFGPALKAFLLCLLIGGSGVGYVWQKDQIARLALQIRSREIRLGQLEDQNEKLSKQLATMHNPQYVEAQIRKLNLGLVQPQQSQIWRLKEPAAEIHRPEPERQYAAQNQGEPAGLRKGNVNPD